MTVTTMNYAHSLESAAVILDQDIKAFKVKKGSDKSNWLSIDDTYFFSTLLPHAANYFMNKKELNDYAEDLKMSDDDWYEFMIDNVEEAVLERYYMLTGCKKMIMGIDCLYDPDGF